MAKYKKKGLNDRQKIFCENYLISLDYIGSCEAAGFSKTTRVLEIPHVQAYIQKKMDERSKRLDISADRVLQELARIAFVDPRSIVGIDGHGEAIVTPTDELSLDDAVCISEIAQIKNKDGSMSTRVKLYDKLAALEKIGKHLKLFTDVQEMNHVFQDMGRVMIGGGDDIEGDAQEIVFNVGDVPDHEKNKLDKR